MPRKDIQDRRQVVAVADEGDVVAHHLADQQQWNGFALHQGDINVIFGEHADVIALLIEHGKIVRVHLRAEIEHPLEWIGWSNRRRRIELHLLDVHSAKQDLVGAAAGAHASLTKGHGVDRFGEDSPGGAGGEDRREHRRQSKRIIAGEIEQNENRRQRRMHHRGEHRAHADQRVDLRAGACVRCRNVEEPCPTNPPTTAPRNSAGAIIPPLPPLPIVRHVPTILATQRNASSERRKPRRLRVDRTRRRTALR